MTNIDDVGRIAQLVQKHAGPTTRAAWERLMPRLQAPPAAAVPEGYALVPVEPTREMIDAGIIFGTSPNKASMIWQNMLAAARKGVGNEQ